MSAPDTLSKDFLSSSVTFDKIFRIKILQESLLKRGRFVRKIQMNRFFYLLGFLFLSFCNVHSEGSKSNSNTKCSTSSEPFVVVELFTSQGCSSCPPADKVLSELSRMYPKKNIFPLSFHVTYWDYIGWKDPYGQKEFSERQERYADANGSRVYTPQAVLNGSKDFVGSNRSGILYSIGALLDRKSDPSLESNSSARLILVSKLSQSKLEVSYSISCVSDRLDLNFALVEKEVTNSVERGENSGKTLAHENVVREFQTLEKAKNLGKIQMNWNSKGKDLSKFALFAYLQNPQTMRIEAANSLPLK